MIEVTNISKVYQMGTLEVPALRGVSFTIRQGEFVAIMGPSGSGKSTLMNVLGCLDTPTSGTYLLDGISVGELSDGNLASIRSLKLGFVFQQYHLLPRQTALFNVQLPLLYRGVAGRIREQRSRTALTIVGMADRMSHLPNELSGGQQQRVAIARALVGSPSVILADEPTGALDTHTSEEIMALLQRLNREQGLTVVLVTHNPEAAAYAARILTMRDGLLVSDETPNQQLPSIGHPVPMVQDRQDGQDGARWREMAQGGTNQ
ncbi:MAG: ABC transporter ATP-binding protein [Chloroflexaceae bacterium]|nr:ABC transporter ATP-binding protein [Chloroflexaceae bacterium]